MRITHVVIAAALPIAGIGHLDSRPSPVQDQPRYQICTMDVNGSNIEVVARDVPFVRSIDWSGGKVRRTLCVRAVGMLDTDIFVYDVETKTETQIPRQGYQLSPSLSRDGSRILYISKFVPETGTGLYLYRAHVMKLDGSDDMMLPIDYLNKEPRGCWWSDTGLTAFYYCWNRPGSDAEENRGVYFYSIALDLNKRLFKTNHLIDSADYTSHGERTVVANGSKLLMFKANGDMSEIALTSGTGARNPHFSDDGQWIASTEGGPYQVCVVKRDGTGFRRIGPSSQHGADIVGLGWAPDGKIVFLRPMPNLKEELRKAHEEAYITNFEPQRETLDRPVKSKDPWVVEPDAKAAGRFGIVRTNWHEKTTSTYQAIYVYLPGEREKQEYYEFFKKEHGVMEGEYDMKINGMMLEKVPVKAGHATRILMGALRFTAKPPQLLDIFDSKDRPVMSILGSETIALPIGTYHLKVGTRTIKVEIKENEVTDF